MSETINIMGGTPKEQWLWAIDMFDLSIGANIETALFKLDEGWEAEEMRDPLDTALRVLNDYTHEMKRLVNAVFED